MGKDPWAKARPQRMGRLRTWWRRQWQDREEWIAQPLGDEPAEGEAETSATAEDQGPPVIGASGMTTFSATLPSALAGMTFAAEFTVDWVEDAGSGLGHPDPDSVVRYAVRRRAGQITARASVTEHARVSDELNARLGFAADIEGTRLRVRSVRVRLTVDPDQLELARRFAEVQRARTVRDVERQLELDELRHLRDTLLADPGTATVWWFNRHRDQPELIPEMADHFHRAAVAIDASRRRTGERVAAVLDDLLRDAGREEPWQLLLVLRHALASLGRHDLAAQLPAAPEQADDTGQPQARQSPAEAQPGEGTASHPAEGGPDAASGDDGQRGGQPGPAENADHERTPDQHGGSPPVQASSPGERATSPQGRASSPGDRATSPEGRATSPEAKASGEPG
jgi:hypothetical protein